LILVPVLYPFLQTTLCLLQRLYRTC